MVRGWIQRRKYKEQQILNCDVSKYFKKEEAQETLTSEKYDPDAAIETRSYTYATGAVYDGEWMGGLRHGKGKMKWSDGCQYEGEW